MKRIPYDLLRHIAKVGKVEAWWWSFCGTRLIPPDTMKSLIEQNYIKLNACYKYFSEYVPTEKLLKAVA